MAVLRTAWATGTHGHGHGLAFKRRTTRRTDSTGVARADNSARFAQVRTKEAQRWLVHSRKPPALSLEAVDTALVLTVVGRLLDDFAGSGQHDVPREELLAIPRMDPQKERRSLVRIGRKGGAYAS